MAIMVASLSSGLVESAGDHRLAATFQATARPAALGNGEMPAEPWISRAFASRPTAVGLMESSPKGASQCLASRNSTHGANAQAQGADKLLSKNQVRRAS